MNIKPFDEHFHYSQLDQKNPLKFTILYRESITTFQEVTGIFRCRDFFNELVVKQNSPEQVKEIYGFRANFPVNKDGIYILLSGIDKMAPWLENFAMINEEMFKSLGVSASLLRIPAARSKVVVHVPNLIFSKTYYISLLTLLWRLGNYQKVYTSVDAMLTNDAFADDGILHNGSAKSKDYVRAWKFSLPESMKKYWWFSTAERNSEKNHSIDYSLAHVIHNNGVFNFASFPIIEAKESQCVVPAAINY